MAHRKQPPFFNEDMAPTQCRVPLCHTMELLIETLTGTCFELRVSRFETVLSVKAKIQRLEGIAISQQHLIWNNVELEDDKCLYDYSIAEGCTLKLVLAMRGGPINTRRVPMEEPGPEVPDDMEATQEEVWERTSLNKQVTFVVYREGEQLNFFRVVDQGNGTTTPVSELISAGSIYNLYTEEAEDDEDGEALTSGQQALENAITMSKMKQLKAKMENMNLSKKPKKTAKLRPHPPAGPRPCSSALGPRLFRVLPQIGQPAGPQCPAPTSDAWQCPAGSHTQVPLRASRLQVAGPRLLKDSVLPALPVLPGQHVEEADPTLDGKALLEEPGLMDLQTLQQAEPLALERSAQRLDLTTQTQGGQASLLPLYPQTRGVVSTDIWPMGTERTKLPPLQMPPEPIPSTSWEPYLDGVQACPKRTEVLSRSRAQEVVEMTGRIPQQPVGLLTSLCQGRGGTGSLLRKMASLQGAQAPTSGCGLGLCGEAPSSVRRTGAPSCSLPPVKAFAAQKKKSSKHCSLCGKRTGLATSYECRCGNNFCASHRYAEAHGCSYDYKGVGRRVLQESHPIITAPKLPKI